jgi:pilus assembly protein CpaE
MPLEGVSSEHVLRIVELATREFGTAFVDLPANWTKITASGS